MLGRLHLKVKIMTVNFKAELYLFFVGHPRRVGRGPPRFISKNNVSATELGLNNGHLHLILLLWHTLHTILSSLRIWPMLLTCQGAFHGALQAPYIDPYEVVHGNAIAVSAGCLKAVYVFHRQPRLQEAQKHDTDYPGCKAVLLRREWWVGRWCRDESHRRGRSPLRPNEKISGRLETREVEFLSTQNSGGIRVHKLNRPFPASGLTTCGDRGVSEFQRQLKFYKYTSLCLC